MDPAPRIWLLMGDKAGDNAQLGVVRSRLGWPVEERRLTFLPRYVHGKPWFRASVQHVDLAQSDPLAPPWPDLILTIGRRPAMAALWIKARSGGRTRVVLFGRPKRWLARFDLVVVPVQYAVPEAANVLHVTLPLMRLDSQRLADAAAAWQPRLADLPRPLIGVLVGGSTFPYRLDAETALGLLDQAKRYAGATGTVYVTTSRRTPAAAAAALAGALPPGGYLYRWGDDAGDNPYPGLLAHGDGFVVTGDSVSMITEVAREGCPLAIYPLPYRRGVGSRLLRLATRMVAAAPWLARAPGVEALGLRLFPRDLTRIHHWLYQRGMAAPAGQPLPRPATAVPARDRDDDLHTVVGRISKLARAERTP